MGARVVFPQSPGGTFEGTCLVPLHTDYKNSLEQNGVKMKRCQNHSGDIAGYLNVSGAVMVSSTGAPRWSC